MVSYVTGGSSGGAAVNPNSTIEVLGQGTNAAGTTITSSASANTYGTAVNFGTTSNAWVGFWVDVYAASGTTTRYLLAISLDGGSNYKEPIYHMDGGNRTRYFFPVALAASTNFFLKVQANNTGSPTVKVIITGIISATSNPPGFTTWDGIVPAVTASTSPSATGLTPATATTLTNIGSTTSQTYGAFMVNLGTTSVPSTTRSAYLRLGYGGGPTLIGGETCPIGAFTNSMDGFTMNCYASVPSGTQMAAGIESANTDGSILIQLIGFR